MPRLTPEQLREARKLKESQRRKEQQESEARAEARKARLEYLQGTRTRWTLLNSVLDGLYTEFEKLTKKSPADEITNLALKRINVVIKDAKGLLKDDSYVDSIDPFVAAGDLPQLRDALMILRELKQGMERQHNEYRNLHYAVKGSWPST